MTLADLGNESWNLTMIAPDTEDTKTGMRRAEKLGMHAMEASETRIAPGHAKAVESPWTRRSVRRSDFMVLPAVNALSA
jgi:hypothetical protein